MYRTVVTLIIVLLLVVPGIAGRTMQMVLDNGMSVILKENRSVPLVAGIVYVRAGSKFEDGSNNGFTHFLEHLLFDGTANRSGIELQEAIKERGGYINAFTRKDLTAYLFVVPSAHVEFALELQADQLFNSTLPESEFPKERKVVIEEINKSYDDPRYRAEMFFDSLIYAGTPFGQPVLGSKQVIENIPREEVLSYYKQRYLPNNMIGLFIGDFVIEDFAKFVNTYYGRVPAAKLPPVIEKRIDPPYDSTIHLREFPTEVTYVHIVFPAPNWPSADYYAMDMLAQMLAAKGTSPLYKALSALSSVSDVSVYLEAQAEFCLLHIDITAAEEANVEKIVAITRQALGQIADRAPTSEELRRVVTRNKVQAIFDEEKLHYYGMLVASKLVNFGYSYIENYVSNLSRVKPADIQKVAREYLADGRYLAMAMVPIAEKSD